MNLFRLAAVPAAVAAFSVFAACDGEVLPIAENRSVSDAEVARSEADAGTDSSASVECCPIDDVPGCCMAYGGTKTSPDACGKICDGMPVPTDPEWVRTKNADGCEQWSNPYSYGTSPDPMHDPRLCGAAAPPDGG